MKESKLEDMSMDFSIQVLQTVENIKGHHSIVNQLERSATSIGANIREARYAHSKPDFIAKLQIALKECYEAEYWLELIGKARILEQESLKHLTQISGAIRRILIASINTTKTNQNN